MSRRTLFEVGAVALTGLLHPVFVDVLHLRGLFIGAALLFWVGYIAARVRADRSLPSRWGFTARGLRGASLATGSIALLAAAIMAAIAAARGTLSLDAHILPLLLLYPIWGLAQQFMVQGIFVRALTDGPAPALRPGVVTLLAALLFAVVHLPDPALTLATFLMGLTFTPTYLRWRNLWPLGLCHGWLGALCYFWVLGRDPWLEVIGHPAAGL